VRGFGRLGLAGPHPQIMDDYDASSMRFGLDNDFEEVGQYIAACTCLRALRLESNVAQDSKFRIWHCTEMAG